MGRADVWTRRRHTLNLEKLQAATGPWTDAILGVSPTDILLLDYQKGLLAVVQGLTFSLWVCQCFKHGAYAQPLATV